MAFKRVNNVLSFHQPHKIFNLVFTLNKLKTKVVNLAMNENNLPRYKIHDFIARRYAQ